jgi:hypothetical protein
MLTSLSLIEELELSRYRHWRETLYVWIVIFRGIHFDQFFGDEFLERFWLGSALCCEDAKGDSVEIGRVQIELGYPVENL